MKHHNDIQEVFFQGSYLHTKDEKINDLVYVIAKKIDHCKEDALFKIKLSQNRKQNYLKLKTFRQLKRLYGIQGWRDPKNKSELFLRANIDIINN